MSGLTNSGFQPETTQEVLAKIVADLQTYFGAQFALDTTSPEAQLAATFSDQVANVWAAAESTYNAFYPNTATGAALDEVASITGISRLPAIPSNLSNVSIYGDAGTVIPALTFKAHVGGAPLSQFMTLVGGTIGASPANTTFSIQFGETPVSGSWTLQFGDGTPTGSLAYNIDAATLQTALQALTYPGAGGILVTGNIADGFICEYSGANAGIPDQIIPILESNSLLDGSSNDVTPLITLTELGGCFVELPMQAVTNGPIQAPPLTLNQIDTPMPGVTNILNYEAAAVGQLVETDAALRVRRAQSLQRASASNLEAIRTAILTVENVTTATVFENDDSATDGSGRPGHSFEAIVTGGTDLAVATQIFLSKPAGIQAYGTTVVPVTDSMGNVHDIGFSRPSAVTFYVEAVITTNTDSSLGPVYPADGDDAVKAAILALAAFQVAGQSVIPTQYIGAVVAAVPGIFGIVMKMDIVTPPVNTANYALLSQEIASIVSANVTVTS